MDSIGDNEIQLWFTYNDKIDTPLLLEQYHKLMSEDEAQRYQRFHFAKHKHQFLISRALLREALSFYSQREIQPSQWEFEKNPYGKPYVAFPTDCNLHFNLSHCDNLIALAVTKNSPVGIDAEWTGRKNKTIELASRYFSELEAKAMQSLDPQAHQQHFYELWTLKEAYIKACGLGLSLPLDQFSFIFPEPRRIYIEFSATRQDNPQHWQFWLLDIGSTHKTAVAIKHNGDSHYRITMQEAVPLLTKKSVTFPIIRRSKRYNDNYL